MRNLNKLQVRSISDFLNKVSAAWFASAAITPFLQQELLLNKILLASVEMAFSGFFLWGSVVILKGVKA